MYGADAPPEGEHIFYAFVCRVCLGHYVRTLDGYRNLDDKSQPIFANSSKRELSAIPGADPPGTPYHSILVEKGGKVKRHREFICMHSDQTYPEVRARAPYRTQRFRSPAVPDPLPADCCTHDV